MEISNARDITRRQFVLGACSGLALSGLSFNASALNKTGEVGIHNSNMSTLRGNTFDLGVGYTPVNFTGQQKLATVVNGGLPGPILRWQEGETVNLRVTNHLAEDSSIHWHGIILPANMDGVPGLSFAGIKPGETFEYRFKVQQSGTYWYHSHSGFQEQTGMMGAIVIDPAEPDPVASDREYVLMLSDWSDEDPADVYATLKKMPHYYNRNERTVGDLLADIRAKGVAQTWRERAMWNRMRMSDRDIADVTGYTYTYLMNGNTPQQGWHGLFKPGERIRLRIINASAMTIFDLRIPGLKMTVVAADGQNVQPVTVDEFRIGVAETYDVIVEPQSEEPYCIFAQSIDRSGFAVGNLSTRPGLVAKVPPMDKPPVLTHGDMGMGHGSMAMNHGEMNPGDMDHSGHSQPDDHAGHGIQTGHIHHQGMGMALGKAGMGSTAPISHPISEKGFQVDMQAEVPQNGIDDPGLGLRHHMHHLDRKVLTYKDLVGLHPTRDRREPQREIQLHLTGNMHRYMWSFDGIKYAHADPVELQHGERLRITLVNDTVMTHPIHLHGLWSELETGEPDYIPRKHTVLVQPGAKVSYLVTADALGQWAYHCHLLYHMPGMFRTVRVK